MGIKVIDVNRLPLLVKANGLPNGDQAVADVRANIRQEFGDGFSRINAAELKHLREKYYARERVPGSVRLLDLLIGTLDPQARSAGPEAEQASAGPSAQPSREASAPADAPDSTHSVTAKATSLLKSLGGSSSSAPSTPARRLTLEEYAKPPRVFKAGNAAPQGGVEAEASGFSDDGAVLRCLSGFDLHTIQASDPEKVTTVALEPVNNALEGTIKRLSAGSKYVYAAHYKAKPNDSGLAEGQLYVWNAETGKLLTNDRSGGAEASAFAPVLREERTECDWLSADAARFVTVCSTGLVREHCLRTGNVTESRLPASQTFDISKDGRFIFGKSSWIDGREPDASSEGAHLYVRGRYGFFEEVPLENFAFAGGKSAFMGFSDDGAYAAVWVLDEGIRVWNTQTGEVRMVAEDHWPISACAAISDDGRILATVLEETDVQLAVQLYDIDTGEPLGKPIPLELPPGFDPAALSFSPDGHLLFVRNYGTKHRVIAFG